MSEESQILVASGSGIQTIVPQLAAASPQIVYLDFDGAETSYDNRDLDIFIDNITVEDSGFDSIDITYIVDTLNAQFKDGIVFTAELPETEEYSTIYIGVTSAFDAYGDFLGIAETIDSGNQIRDDNAFVFLNSTASVELVTSVIVHEAGHLMGTFEHGEEGLMKYAATINVSNGQIYDRIVVNSGTTVTISNGGVANDIVIRHGGIMILSGGIANGTVVSSGGTLRVGNSGVTSAITNSTTVSNGGWMYLYGVATSLTLKDGGRASIFSGGSADNITISNGGFLSVKTGASATNIIWTPFSGSVDWERGGYVTFKHYPVAIWEAETNCNLPLLP